MEWKIRAIARPKLLQNTIVYFAITSNELLDRNFKIDS
jgi:hypothetical protein